MNLLSNYQGAKDCIAGKKACQCQWSSKEQRKRKKNKRKYGKGKERRTSERFSIEIRTGKRRVFKDIEIVELFTVVRGKCSDILEEDNGGEVLILYCIPILEVFN